MSDKIRKDYKVIQKYIQPILDKYDMDNDDLIDFINEFGIR